MTDMQWYTGAAFQPLCVTELTRALSVQELSDLEAMQQSWELMEYYYHIEASDKETLAEWVNRRQNYMLKEIENRASQHEADEQFRDAEFLYRRIIIPLHDPSENLFRFSGKDKVLNLIRTQIQIGDFTAAEC